MIRFHVLNDEIVRLSVTQDVLDIVKPFVGKILIDSVHDGDLAVHDDIGVVRHAVRNSVLPFKKVNFVVVDTYVLDIISDFHLDLFSLTQLYIFFAISL